MTEKGICIKVFINAKGSVGNISEGLKNFLVMISEHKAMDDFTRKVQEAVDYLHMDEEARIAYMTVGMKIIEECKYAREEGFEDGVSQGADINLIELIIKKVNKGKSIEVIADELEEKTDNIREMFDAVVANPNKKAKEIYDILNT